MNAPLWTPARPDPSGPAGPIPIRRRPLPRPRVLPRDQLTVPVCPVPEPSDTVLFERSDDPARKLYLPRYRVVDDPPLRLRLAQGANDWSLSVELEKYRAPEVEQSGADAEELPHDVGLTLRFAIVSGGVILGVRELPLDERTATPGGVRAVLRGTDSATRDQIHLAMIDQVYAAELVVRRSTSVGVLVPGSGGRVVSSGQGVLRGTWMFDFDSGQETTFGAADVWWEQHTDVLRELVVQSGAATAALGARDFDALTVDDLAGVAYSTTPLAGNVGGPNELGPGTVFAVRTSSGNFAKVRVVEYGYNLTLQWVTYSTDRGPAGAPVVTAGQGVLHGTWLFDVDTGAETSGDGADLWWEQQTDTARLMVPTGGAAIAPLGPAAFDALLPSQVAAAPFSTNPIPGHVNGPNQLVAGSVFAVRTAAGNVAKMQVVEYGYNLRLRWVTFGPGGDPPAPAPDRYRVTAYSDETAVAPKPFVFPSGSPIFSGLGDASGPDGLTRTDVSFRGRPYSYYQDAARPWIFYHLPDEFRLARRDDPPHVPALSVQLGADLADVEATQVTFGFTAVPFVDPGRLDAAVPALRPLLPGSLPSGVTGPVHQALQVPDGAVTYTLSIPSRTGSTGAQPRPTAFVDLRTGIVDTLTMAMADFRPVYQALFADTELFRGDVAVRVGSLNTEHVRLIARISRTSGPPVLDVAGTPAGPGRVHVRLTNRIESPVTVNTLAARLTGLPAQVGAVAPPLPALLPPGSGLDCDVVAPVPEGTAPEAVIDLGGVVVNPEPHAVWDAVVVSAAPAVYRFPITLEVFASAFAGADRAVELIVDFRAGTNVSVQVTSDQLREGAIKVSVPVDLAMPLVDWLVNASSLNEYQYRVTAVRLTGTATGPWVRRQSSILPIQVVPLVDA
ncbi:hypothetical protein [Cryptosporangium sp. NPDC051539]|uniref:hypothetical protein n=1 Tax=Cryptosporangium sp. NPDC051539 TaxID=3363962 RepID=UPI0037964204